VVSSREDLIKKPVELSSRLEYALVALLEIAERQAQGKPLKVNEIAASQSLPERYLDQIFTLLKRQGILSSQRGMKGGYLLAKELWQISLLDIVMAIEGGSNQKKVDPSISSTIGKVVVVETFEEIKGSCDEILASYTLQDLAKSVESRRQSSPMYYI
jgi:Rrf2 family protein